MARVLSVSKLKSEDSTRKRPPRVMPEPGTTLRQWFDTFKENEGVPLTVTVSHSVRRALTDHWGLDIICLEPSRSLGGYKGATPGTYVLAGEWFGKDYVDYIARKFVSAT